MSERCKQCEQYEKSLKDVRERRTNLWRRGELTDAASEKLAAEEQRIAEELKKHQATQHEQELAARTQPKPQPFLFFQPEGRLPFPFRQKPGAPIR